MIKIFYQIKLFEKNIDSEIKEDLPTYDSIISSALLSTLINHMKSVTLPTQYDCYIDTTYAHLKQILPKIKEKFKL